MRIFDKFPEDIICPVCGTSKEGQCILIPINGTQDGGNVQAKPIHLECVVDNAVLYTVKGASAEEDIIIVTCKGA